MFVHRRTDSQVKDVAAALSVQVPTLSEVIKDLVRKGWIMKQRANHDGRAVLLRLSRTGQRLAKRIDKEVKEVEAITALIKEE